MFYTSTKRRKIIIFWFDRLEYESRTCARAYITKTRTHTPLIVSRCNFRFYLEICHELERPFFPQIRVDKTPICCWIRLTHPDRKLQGRWLLPFLSSYNFVGIFVVVVEKKFLMLPIHKRKHKWQTTRKIEVHDNSFYVKKSARLTVCNWNDIMQLRQLSFNAMHVYTMYLYTYTQHMHYFTLFHFILMSIGE